MRSDPAPVERLTLLEMAAGEGWTETWRFTVKATSEAKGVILEDGGKGDDGSDSGSE